MDATGRARTVASVSLTFRDLEPGEFEQLASIDRAEHIDAQYVLTGDTIEPTPCAIDVLGWYPDELTGYNARLHDLSARGGVVVGAWDDAALVGLASLDPAPIGVDPTMLKLDMLYVGRAHRHRGIGSRLVATISERARGLGATALYISSSPTRNTVDAYRRMGAVVLGSPDPRLFAFEPDDIHLRLPI